MGIINVKFDVYFKRELGTLFKSNEVDLDGLEANVNLDLELVESMKINYLINGNKLTDDIAIKDIEKRLILIPFKSEVRVTDTKIKFEIQANMKNGDVKVSQTYVYDVEMGIGEGTQVGTGGSGDGHTHNNLSTLHKITEAKIKAWDAKSDFSGSYNDLTNKPTIPTVDVTKSYVDGEVSKKADRAHSHSEYATPSYVQEKIAEASLSGGEVDLSAYATKAELNTKADKTHTHNELHSHSNKTVLDGITSSKVNEWDNKSTFNGDYNSLTNKPAIPSIEGLATENYVQEKIAEASLNGGDVDLSGYATKEELSNKSDKTHNHSYNDLTDKPTIPSLDGYATESFVTQKIAEASFGDTEGSPVVLIEPSDNDVPKLFFTGTFPTTKDSTTMEFEYVSKTKRFKGYVDIKCQGTTSMGFPKKNFTIKLYEDEEKTIKMTQNFKKWGEQTKFCLKANYVDTTHTRNISGARVAYDMIESRPDSEFKTYLATSPRNGVIDGFPIKVFNNGMFYGIYTLNIPKDEWMFGMDKDNPNHMVLCAEENNNGNMSANGTCQFRALWTNSNNSHWSVEVGTLTDEMRNSFNNAIRHVMNTTDEQFVADMDKCFDVDSLVDYFCFSYFMCHLDGLAKNMLMVTYDGVHWGASLYDMDTIYGAWYDGTRFVAHDYKCPEQYQENNSLLWQRLSKNFSQKIQDRYFELRKGALSLGNVVSHVENIYDLLSDRDLTEERNKWTGLPSVNANTIPRFREYMNKRCSYVDAKMLDFVEIPCTKLTLNTDTLIFTDGNSQKLIATVEPSNTTQSIVWTSSPSGVVSVNNGVVKPLKRGNCVLTANCGEQSATCDIVVDFDIETPGTLLLSLDSSTLTSESIVWEDLSGNNNNFTISSCDVTEQGLNVYNCSCYGATTIPIKDQFTVEMTFTVIQTTSNAAAIYSLNLDNTGITLYADTMRDVYGIRGYDDDIYTSLKMTNGETYNIKLEYGDSISLYSNDELVGTYNKNSFTPNDAYRFWLGCSKINNRENLHANIRLKSFKLYSVNVDN